MIEISNIMWYSMCAIEIPKNGIEIRRTIKKER